MLPLGASVHRKMGTHVSKIKSLTLEYAFFGAMTSPTVTSTLSRPFLIQSPVLTYFFLVQ